MKYIVCIVLGICLTACMKEELPVPRKDHGDVKISSVAMGNNYKYQVFYSLSEDKEISKNVKSIWDIGFETGEYGTHIITNTSKYMFVYKTEQTSFNEILSKNDCLPTPLFDSPTGSLDSTGIGDWSDGYIRVLDLGTTEENEKLGWYKIKVNSVSTTAYNISYAKIDETEVTTVDVPKKGDYNFTYFSLLNSKIVDVAPETKEWDLVFTQLIVRLTKPFEMDYLVTGCLTNPSQTLSALVTEREFEDIDLAYAASLPLSGNVNTIGYDWKDVGLDNVMEGGTADYKVYPEKSYVVQDQNGKYFKLKFISFYSETGEKGNPSFIIEELK